MLRGIRNIGFKNVSGSTYDADAQAFIDKVEISDVLTTLVKDSINTMVLDLKSLGLWSKGHAYYPMIGSSASSHRWNLFDPEDTNSAFRGTFSGGGTHDSSGYTGNGTNSYMDTHLVPNTHLTYNDTCVVFVSGSSMPAGDGVALGVNESGSKMIYLNPHHPNGNAYGDQYNNTTGRVGVSVADGLGIYISNRSSSTLSKLYKDGVEIGSSTGASGTFPTASIMLNTFYNGASFVGYYEWLCQGAGIFDGLTSTEVSDLNDIIDDFNTAVR